MNSGTVVAETGGVDHHNQGRADHANNRDVTDEIEGEVLIERDIGGGNRVGPQQRVAVSRCARDRVGSDIGGSTRSIVDDERLAKSFR
jgi:hypothetical protein